MKKLGVVLAALVMLAGCTSAPPKPAEQPQPKPPEYLTGRAGFYKVYPAARAYARDAQPFRLESQASSGSKGQDAKAGIWRTGFASPIGRGVKTFVWSGLNDSDAPARGISASVEDNYNPSNSSTAVFDANFFKIDSDKALEVAQKHGGDKVLEKNPNLPVLYLLDWSRPESKLIWHVIYGDSRNNARLVVDVDATTGEFLRVEK